MSDVVVADRYSVFGPPNGCDGPCEGTGWVPVCPPLGDPRRTFWAPRLGRDVTSTFPGPWAGKDDESRALQDLWRAAEAKKRSDDGTHFVPCPRCKQGAHHV